LRAGQSLWSLTLSRSREYGLRDEQHAVAIHPNPGGGMVVEYRPPNSIDSLTLDRVEFCQELERVLSRLMEQDID
jgi:hypothetical protein